MFDPCALVVGSELPWLAPFDSPWGGPTEYPPPRFLESKCDQYSELSRSHHRSRLRVFRLDTARSTRVCTLAWQLVILWSPETPLMMTPKTRPIVAMRLPVAGSTSYFEAMHRDISGRLYGHLYGPDFERHQDKEQR